MEMNVSPAMTRPTHWVRPTPGSAASAHTTTNPSGAAHTAHSSQRCRASSDHGRGNSTTNAARPAQPMTYTTWVRNTYSHRTGSPRASMADTPSSIARSLLSSPPPSTSSPPVAGPGRRVQVRHHAEEQDHEQDRPPRLHQPIGHLGPPQGDGHRSGLAVADHLVVQPVTGPPGRRPPAAIGAAERHAVDGRDQVAVTERAVRGRLDQHAVAGPGPGPRRHLGAVAGG